MSDNTEIGGRIRRAREARGLKGYQLAELSGLRPDQVSRYEHGRVTPGTETLGKIAVHLGVTVDWLATGRGDGPREGDGEAA